MNDKLDSNKNYEILDGDDDVLLLGKATFKVRRLKELAASKFSEILGIYVVKQDQSRHGIIINWMNELRINEETIISGGDINWNSPQEGIDCQVLKIGSKGW